MNLIREQIGISLQELEIELLATMREQIEHAVQAVFTSKMHGISNTPIAYASTTSSGGMSNLMRRLNNSAMPN